MRCFCCKKEEHVKVDFLVWKKVTEEEEKNSKLKVGINVVMVEWDQLVVDVCVAMQGQKARMPVEEPPEREVNLIMGR